MTEMPSEPPIELLPNGDVSVADRDVTVADRDGDNEDVAPSGDDSSAKITKGDVGRTSRSETVDASASNEFLTSNSASAAEAAAEVVAEAAAETAEAASEAEGVEEVSRPDVQYLDKSTNDIRFVDADGWEDLLGSGRLRKRVIVEGDPKNHPARGSQVKIHFKGKVR